MSLLATEGIRRQCWYSSRSASPPLPSSVKGNMQPLIQAPAAVWCELHCRDPYVPWEGRYKASWKSGIQTPTAQGRSTAIISMIQWSRTSRLSIKISLSLSPYVPIMETHFVPACVEAWERRLEPSLPRPTTDKGYSKLRTHTALGPYGRSIPRSIGPA
jgi:hypothetical protein